MLLLAGFCRDTFGELALKAMEGVTTICATEDLQDPLVPYAAALARVSMPNLRHRHAKVRRGAVDAVRRAVAVKHVAKWRAAGSDAIADLVGFREDNVIPTASFYGREVRYNYVAELTRDNNVAVRQALVDCFAEWFTQTLDRRDSQPRLLAYMLNFAIDRDERVRKSALDGLAAAGREMMEESQSRENNIEKINEFRPLCEETRRFFSRTNGPFSIKDWISQMSRRSNRSLVKKCAKRGIENVARKGNVGDDRTNITSGRSKFEARVRNTSKQRRIHRFISERT